MSSLIFFKNNLETAKLIREKKMLTLETFVKMHNNKCSNDIIKPFKYLDSVFIKFLSQSKYFIHFIKLILNILMIIFCIKDLIFFIKNKPDIFFSAHPFTNHDLHLQFFSRLFNLKRYALIYSWDNVTSKFRMHYDYDKILVWNKILKKQLIRIYNYETDKIKIVGIPQFDDYIKVRYSNKKDFFFKHKIKSNLKLVIIFGTSEEYIPHLTEILKKIDYIFNRNNLYNNVHVWLRPHPTSRLEYEKIFPFKNVTINKPPTSFIPLEKNEIGTYSKENIFFAELLKNCDLIINFFSTTILDGIYFNKPIINPIIENSKKPISRYCRISTYINDWEHMRNIKRTKGVLFAYNYNDLEKLILKCLKNKKFNIVNQKKIFNNQINFSLGKSREVIANEILY